MATPLETRSANMPMFRLDGHSALVTGAGGGLGRAIADCLAGQGVRVWGSSRDPAVASEIADRYSTSPVVLDTRDVGNVASVIEHVYGEAGGIDLLCNNAGVNVPQPALDVDLESWNQVLSTNVTGVFFVQQAFARIWAREHVAGRVVNVSSQAGTVAIEDRAAYGSSKAAVSHMTRVLALEWAPLGIRVNAVAPTFIRTQLTESTLKQPGREEQLLSRIPLGRLGLPEDVASAVLYLFSDEASLVTGHILAVDGGYTIH